MDDQSDLRFGFSLRFKSDKSYRYAVYKIKKLKNSFSIIKHKEPL